MSKIDNFFNEIKRGKTIFESFFDTISNSDGIKKTYNSLSKYKVFIGLLENNYKFMEMNLYRNIGNKMSMYDGYGTPIGSVGDKMLNYKTGMPWYYYDHDKTGACNYLDYISNTYSNTGALINNFYNDDFRAIIAQDNNPLLNDKIGVVRTFDISDKSNVNVDGYSTKRLSPNGNDTDTKLGFLSDFYLNETLKLTLRKDKEREFEWITPDVQKLFGINGTYGIKDTRELPVKTVRNQDEYTKNVNLTQVDGIGHSNFNYTGLIDNTNGIYSQYSFDSIEGIGLINREKNNVKYNYENTYIKQLEGTVLGKSFDKIDGKNVRYNFIDIGNDNLWSCKTLYTYAEPDGNRDDSPSNIKSENTTYNDGISYGKYSVYSDVSLNKEDIISYTNKLFKNREIDTLIGRFHSTEFESITASRASRDMISTSVSKYGMSKGRNLLRKDHMIQKEGDYSNPYCRVWTFHHQYSKLQDTIRPFYDDLESSEVSSYRTKEGLKKLKKYGVKGDNGLINIAPTENDNGSTIKKCMFSIENLAWKGEKQFFDKRKDQKGPLGGRIMWFPPYDLKFDESVNVNWGQNQFIGRGENIYTYTNTERDGSLSFKLLIDHPSVINSYRGCDDGIGDVDDVESKEQTLLRFFAGCDILEGKKVQQVDNERQEVEVTPVTPEVPPLVPDVVVPKTTYKEIIFYVYYPNNYSGVDDSIDENKVSAIPYLINGCGANKYVIKSEVNDGSNELNVDNFKSIKDYSINRNNLIENFFGYEIDETLGVSSYRISSADNDIITLGPTKKYDSYGTNYYFTVHKCKNKAGKNNYWGYRVDSAYENEVLRLESNYYDTVSYGLNSSGYKKLTLAHKDAQTYIDNGSLYSFIDVYFALSNVAIPNYLSKYVSEGNVNKIKKLLNEYEVTNIEGLGFASAHGHVENNKKLAKNRCSSVLKWINKMNPNKFKKGILKTSEPSVQEMIKEKSVNSLNAKIWRSAKITIKLKLDGMTKMKNEINFDLRSDEDSYSSDDNLISSVDNLGDKAKKNTDDEYNDILPKFPNWINLEEQERAEADAKKLESEKNGKNLKDDVKIDGYGNEYKFFEELERNKPFLHDKLTEKIRYFDPAFHSITPEGFQSRLTFLHQCTRQGNTVSRSDNKNEFTNAKNLAFGRPPICVLRIGDFYNTKIIINNMSISYDEASWDLNDEGIGVMPMMADVRLSFKFLGGSDLSGPINRLQNALSFNHYGNTSVYDDMAEEITYDKDGKIIDFKAK